MPDKTTTLLMYHKHTYFYSFKDLYQIVCMTRNIAGNRMKHLPNKWRQILLLKSCYQTAGHYSNKSA